VRDGVRVPYTSARTERGDAHLRPQLPIVLGSGTNSLETVGLVDSGADVNVLPYRIGVELGAEWSTRQPAVQLSGNLGLYEARGIVLDAVVGSLPSVRLAFAWTRAEHVPLLLGQVNFCAEFDVCFFRSLGFGDTAAGRRRASAAVGLARALPCRRPRRRSTGLEDGVSRS
jgi:hypothetical protein